MPQPSGLLSAGRIVLVVGACLTAVSALWGLLPWLVTMGYSLALRGSWSTVASSGYYALQAVLLAASATLGFLAFARAWTGDAHGAWVRGLVASLLPVGYTFLNFLSGPVGAQWFMGVLSVVLSVQYVLLVGAVLCRTSPEAQGPAPAPLD